MSKDLAASIRQRLLNLAQERREDFNFILSQFVIQRLLYRLSRSTYREQFLLKGAWLFTIWSQETHRPTRDADFLCFGNNDVDTLVTTFKAICAFDAEDGLAFDIDSISGIQIKEDAIYQGVRISGYAYLTKARIAFQVDVAFGDVVTPTPVIEKVPVFLGLPAPELRVYPVYSVIAEKFQAMVALGIANSRMKDFYDIWRIAQMMNLDGGLLLSAISATFNRRGTVIDKQPLYVFSEEFGLDKDKNKQWLAFLNKSRLGSEPDFKTVLDQLAEFLEPVYKSAATQNGWSMYWSSQYSKWLNR